MSLLAVFGVVETTFAAVVSGFMDVPDSHPNYAAIMDLKVRGVVSGYPDGTFRPNQAVNRVEALKIILNAAKIGSTTSTAKAIFSDVDATQWYMPYLRKAVELKIVAGYSDGTFKPLQTVNLAENLKMLLNAEKIDLNKLVVGADPFVDVMKNDWFASYVQYAKDKKLIDSDLMNKVYPAQGMTRAKLAELAYRLIDIKERSLDYFGQVKEDTPGKAAPGSINNGVDTTMLVNIKGNAFSLASMTIGQGTTVRWTNGDSLAHTVTSDNGTFSSPSLSNGDSWTYTFNDLGTFDYHCSVHPMMKATIIVKPAHMVPTI